MTNRATDGVSRVLVLIGTKAQLVKMAPVLRRMDDGGVPYWLVYSGQHSETFEELEKLFGLRPANEVLVADFEAATHASFARWTLRFWSAALRRLLKGAWRHCRIGLVHGDTASTLFAAIAMRLAGVPVAHVEAGLRSPRLFDPFPEEIVRRLVSHLSRWHYVPNQAAAGNLFGLHGEIIDTGGNTLRDALEFALARVEPDEAGRGGYAVVSIHRNENLSSVRRFDQLMKIVAATASTCPVKFVLHPATRARLAASGWADRLRDVDAVELVDRMDYLQFTRTLIGSCFLMTDGGSNQEEAAMLGLPTLLLRMETERPDGIGANVVLSRLDEAAIRRFVAEHAGKSWTLQAVGGVSPSDRIVKHVQTVLS